MEFNTAGGLTFEGACALVVMYCNPEMADMNNPRGEIYGYRPFDSYLQLIPWVIVKPCILVLLLAIMVQHSKMLRCEHTFKRREEPHREDIINESDFSHLRQYLGRLKKHQWMAPYYKRWWSHWDIQKFYVYFKDDDSVTVQITMV